MAGDNRLHDLLAPVVAAQGLYLERVRLTRAGKHSVLEVTVDLAEDEVGGVGLEVIAAASTAISAALDAADPVSGQYVLDVTSPGTSRPLTELRHFKRARTRLVALTLADGASMTGRLTEVGADGLVLSTEDGGRVVVPLAEVKSGRVVVELKAAASAELDAEGVTMDGEEDR